MRLPAAREFQENADSPDKWRGNVLRAANLPRLASPILSLFGKSRPFRAGVGTAFKDHLTSPGLDPPGRRVKKCGCGSWLVAGRYFCESFQFHSHRLQFGHFSVNHFNFVVSLDVANAFVPEAQFVFARGQSRNPKPSL